MRPAALCLTLVLATPALAHIKLTAPPDWLVTDPTSGDPQKQPPCGLDTGTKSNIVTPVVAGQKLTVKWQDTLYHPGHFRIAITDDRSKLFTPDAGGLNDNCPSAYVQNPAIAPVILDNLFPHTTQSPTGLYEQEITIPDLACDNCTLQLIQFMQGHGYPCFYYHCATLKISRPVADGGTSGDAGQTGSDAGQTGSDAGQLPGDAGAKLDGGTGTPEPPVGCGCGAGAGGIASLALLASLARYVKGRRRF